MSSAEGAAWFHPRILVGSGDWITPARMARHNITHVVNCAMDEFTPLWWRLAHPLQYAVMNAIDSPGVNILAWYPKFETALRRFLREGDGVVYVHCQAGMNRSAFLALTFVCKNFGNSYDFMMKVTKHQRPCMYQNQVFMNQTREFVNGRL